ncbi:MAG: SH3 domain-containing protein [Dehalococcoidia bacterium]
MESVVLLLATCAALLAAACGGGSKATPTPSPSASDTTTTTATATATPTPEPETILGVTVTPLVTGSDIPFPKDAALYIESGCWGCDAPAAALQRMYRDPSGALRTEDLYRLDGATIAAPEVDGRYIMSVAAGAELNQDLLLSLCESPYCGGVGNMAEGAKTSILHSSDGGVTWTKEVTLDGGAWVIANLGPKSFGLIRRIHRPAPGADWVREIVSYPGLDTFPMGLTGEAAVNARFLVPAHGPPFVLADDGISLHRYEQPLNSDPWPDFRHLPAGSRILDLQFVDNGILVTWTDEQGTLYSGITEWPEPPKPIVFKAIYRWPADVQPTFLRYSGGGFLASGEWIPSASWPGLQAQIPVVVDFKAGTIRPIAEFRERAQTDRNLVRAVLNGPFARVTGAGENDCLNVREQPSLSSTPFACYADGTLLVEQGQRTEADGHNWSYVNTPSGRSGWASQSFLETSGSAPSLNYHPKGTRTGNAAVDAVISALESGDLEAIAALIGWQQVECEGGPPMGIGGPPECPEGVADGTPIDVIPGAACEGYWHIRLNDGGRANLVIGTADRLYAVIKNDADSFWRGSDTGIVYVNPERPEWGKAVYLANGRIIGDWSGCATSPAEIAERGASVIFPPPSP